MTKNEIIEKITKNASEIARKKVEQELDLANKKIESESKIIADICKKIETGFWVKKAPMVGGYHMKFIVATIEEFEKDYFKETKSLWQQGLTTESETKFIINGVCYFHISDLWNEYCQKIYDYNNNINHMKSELMMLEKMRKEFEEEFKVFKKCLIDYQNLKDKEGNKSND